MLVSMAPTENKNSEREENDTRILTIEETISFFSMIRIVSFGLNWLPERIQ